MLKMLNAGADETTIRTLLLLTAIASVCALMIRTSDWIAALVRQMTATPICGLEVPRTGIEPVTTALEERCSIQLS